ncbi:MAG: cytochrome b/b6 domain-containing protein [Pseudomonadota bacterium]
MALLNSTTRYGWPAWVMHWTSVVVIALLYIGISGIDRPPKSALRLEILSTHTSLGILMLGLMLARLVWRVTNANPVKAYSLRPLHKLVAISVHRCLYVLVITMALTGVLGHLELPGFSLETTARRSLLALHAAITGPLLLLATVHIIAAVINLVVALPASQGER